MAESTVPYRFEEEEAHCSIALFPELNQAPWGEIDDIGSSLLKQMKAFMEKSRRSPAFLVDLSALNYMGSAMVALVVRLWKAAKEKEGRLAVVNDNEMVLEVLRLSGLEQVWTIKPTREEAMKELGVTAKPAAAAASSSGGASPAPVTVPVQTRSRPGWAILALVLLLVSAGGLFLVTQDPPLVTDLRISLGLLFGGAVLGLIASTAAVFAATGTPRTLGAACLLGCLALMATGVVVHPQGEKLWQRPDFNQPLPQVEKTGDTPDENAPRGPVEAPKPERRPTTNSHQRK